MRDALEAGYQALTAKAEEFDKERLSAKKRGLKSLANRHEAQRNVLYAQAGILRHHIKPLLEE